MARCGDPNRDIFFFSLRKDLKKPFWKFAADCCFSIVWDRGRDLLAQGRDERVGSWKKEQLWRDMYCFSISLLFCRSHPLLSRVLNHCCEHGCAQPLIPPSMPLEALWDKPIMGVMLWVIWGFMCTSLPMVAAEGSSASSGVPIQPLAHGVCRNSGLGTEYFVKKGRNFWACTLWAGN